MGLDGRARTLPLLVLLALSVGCASAHAGPWPYETTRPHPSRVAQGAILGSMAGAAIGAGVDYRNRGRGALVGGLGGLVVGAIFGDQIRQHEAWHRDHDPYAHDPYAHEHGPGCDGEHAWDDDHARQEHGDHTWDDEPRPYEPRPRDPPVAGAPPAEAPLSVEVLFDPGSSTLSTGAEARLRHLARQVRDRDDVELLLRGHSDDLERGGFELSEARARAVRRFLNEEGVSVRRIAWVGFGDAQPVASNETAVGRQRNRRVEVVLRAPEADPYARLLFR